MEYEDVEEPCCGNCAKLTECFGVDVDIEDPYENLLDYCLAYQEIKNEDNRIEMNKRKELLIEALDKDKNLIYQENFVLYLDIEEAIMIA